jgi:hypothetical protein
VKFTVKYFIHGTLFELVSNGIISRTTKTASV